MAKKTRKIAKPKIEFRKGDLVAAKVKGHPSWPGQIEHVEINGTRKRYHVRFFGTNDMSYSHAEIKPFDQMTATELRTKSKAFSDALEECRKVQRSIESNNNKIIETEKELDFEHETEVDEGLQDGDEDDDVVMQEDESNVNDAIKRPQEDTKKVEFGNEVLTRRKKEIPFDKKENELNDTENNKHGGVPKDATLCLPNLSSPDDDEEQDQQPIQTKLGPNSEDISRNCSLNDLTSEQANADRGNIPPSTKINHMQANKRELTLAKLKKKIDTKLEEKAAKKAAFKQQKSFEKASKGLPVLTKKLEPLARSSARLIDDLGNKKAAKQVRTSMKDCEKYLNSLAKCLKLMTSDYGRQQKKCYELHCSLRKIVETLKQIKSCKTLDVARDCSRFVKQMRGSEDIKTFINNMEFPSYNDSITERKENSTIKRRKSNR